MARDNGRFANADPEIKAWFDKLASGRGPCCSDADGTAVSDVDWESKDGHYRVRLPVGAFLVGRPSARAPDRRLDPNRVRVYTARRTRIDFSIDTGIR